MSEQKEIIVVPGVPWSEQDLVEVWRRPHRAADILLTYPERLGATVANERLIALNGTLLMVSVLFALPFGLILGPDKLWSVGILFLGSLAVCFPSLHVFSAFIGRRVDIGQDLALALSIAAVAALFAAGFAPIFWFLQATMGESVLLSARFLGNGLLAFSLFAGLTYQARCMRATPELKASPGAASVLIIWHLLLVFVVVRMAGALGLM